MRRWSLGGLVYARRQLAFRRLPLRRTDELRGGEDVRIAGRVVAAPHARTLRAPLSGAPCLGFVVLVWQLIAGRWVEVVREARMPYFLVADDVGSVRIGGDQQRVTINPHLRRPHLYRGSLRNLKNVHLNRLTHAHGIVPGIRRRCAEYRLHEHEEVQVAGQASAPAVPAKDYRRNARPGQLWSLSSGKLLLADA
ncbi:MAG: hypothetical protein AAF411_17405 [Myxococcota bacterium]